MSHRKSKPTAVSPELNSVQSNSFARGLRVREAASYIGCTVSFLRSQIAEREIPALLLGKRHVLLREDLDEYLDTQRRRA